jgi:ABC-type lipoprotein release transport system permease subunit
MIRLGLAYGILSTRRRVRLLILPIITTATGAFLLVQVMSLTGSVRSQSKSLGDGAEIYRATMLIAVVVLLVGVVEVAVCTTRTIAQRTREIGLLSATGVRPKPVVAALLVEPLIAAASGAVIGSAVAVLAGVLFTATGLSNTPMSAAATAVGVVLAVGVSCLAALLTSMLPSWRAANQPSIKALSYGG